MSPRESVVCIGIAARAGTATVEGTPVLVIARERMLDLMVPIGIALREALPS